MNANASKKIRWATFIANILIVIQHSNITGSFGTGDAITSYIIYFFSRIAIPAMYFFFFISAFLFYRKLEGMEDIISKWKRRIYSLLIPYLIWNTIGEILHLLGNPDELKLGIGHVLRHAYLFYNGVGCGDGPLWYVFRLFTFLAIAPIINYVVKNRYLFATFVFVIIYFNTYYSIGYYDYSCFLPIYLIGAYIGKNHSNKMEEYIGNNKRNIFGLILAIVLYILRSYLSGFFDYELLNIFVSISGVAVVLFMLNAFGTVGKPHEFFGNAGMYIYCMHEPLHRIIKMLLSYAPIPFFVSYFMLILLTFCFIYITWLILYKRCPTALKIISGGR